MKKTIRDLAIFGGAPEFPEPLHVGRPNIGDRGQFIARLNDILDRRWLTNDGQYVQEFEQRIATFVGARNCVATCNATIALELVIRALGLRGEVIVPSFTFVGTVHALSLQGITPVFCDIESHTHNIDATKVEALITPRTTGILAVHLWGQSCNIERLVSIARSYNLKLLFDAAHAFGCSHNHQMIGTFGDAEVFSFHATKFVNSFEGGAVVTDDSVLAGELRLMRNFGFKDFDQVERVGTNGKMSEPAAAMGLTSLENIAQIVLTNLSNYESYIRGVSHISGLRFVRYNCQESNNYQYVVVEIDEAIAGIRRDTLLKGLWAENILARRYFFPGCHRMPPYNFPSSVVQASLPVTEQIAGRVLVLPTGTSIRQEEISRICEIISLLVENAQEVEQHLSDRRRSNSD